MAKRKASGAHKLAIAVSKKEGLKKQLTIAQIKEVINCIFDELWINDFDAVLLNSLMSEAKVRQDKLFKKKLAQIGKEK